MQFDILELNNNKDMLKYLDEKGQWAVKRAGATRPSGIYDSQKEAIQKASVIAQNQGTSVFVHDKEGRVKERLY